MASLRILVDMDNVITDFNGYTAATWNAMYPSLKRISYTDFIDINICENYRRVYGDWAVNNIVSIYTAVGFTLKIPPIRDSIAALREMLAEGHDVYICTSPMSKFYRNQVPEKYEWINQYLGPEWLSRLIIAHDKKLIMGDILIDDNPDIARGTRYPSWRHIIFDQPWNRHVIGQRINNLCQWKLVI